MDPNNLEQQPAPRKLRFKPKSQSQRRLIKAVKPKVEVIDDDKGAEKEELMRRFQGGLGAKPKVERKVEDAPVTTFGGSANPSHHQYTRKYSSYEDKPRDKEHKEYKVPWNYYGYYPTVVPIRRPSSKDPELLDEEEFGQPFVFDETKINTAKEIGLMEENSGPKMLFFQLPRILPLPKRENTAEGEASKSKPSGSANRPGGLNDLKSGYMGKMLVYNSGAVKFKLGETLYDVTPGSNCEFAKEVVADCSFAEEVVAVNTEKKHYCAVSELGKHVIVSPDIDSILDNFGDMD